MSATPPLSSNPAGKRSELNVFSRVGRVYTTVVGSIFIRPKESIMLSDRFMLFSPIELKFFFWAFLASLITK